MAMPEFMQRKPTRAMRRMADAGHARTNVASHKPLVHGRPVKLMGDVTYTLDASDKASQVDLLKCDVRPDANGLSELDKVVLRRKVEHTVQATRDMFRKRGDYYVR